MTPVPTRSFRVMSSLSLAPAPRRGGYDMAPHVARRVQLSRRHVPQECTAVCGASRTQVACSDFGNLRACGIWWGSGYDGLSRTATYVWAEEAAS